MKCLVTGIAGFIGSTLADRFSGLGHEVIGIDSFSDYYDRSLKQSNLARLRQRPHFTCQEGDIASAELASLIDDCQWVFHLAAQAGVRASWGEEFEAYTRCNVLATQRLLEACVQMERPPRVVYASSSSVYGDSERLPQRETDVPRPVSPYGVTKLAGEHLVYLYWKNFQLPTVSLRFFTVYGPRQRPDMAFHKFMRAHLRGESITVFGDGTQTRDFTFVDDIVEGLVAAAERGRPGAVYNLGGGHRASVREVLDIIGRISGRPVAVEYVEQQKGDVRDTQADTTAAQRDLGFAPKTDLETGLRREWEWICRLYGDTS